MNQEKLLKAIESNARYSTEDLARMLNEEKSDVEEAIKTLEDNKTICGYNTVINYEKSPFETVTAVIEVGCTPRRESGYEEIAKEIYSYDEVSTMYLMSGKSEFIVIIKGKTMKEVASFVTHHLAPIENVTRTETYFVLKQYKVEGIEIGGEKKEDDRILFML